MVCNKQGCTLVVVALHLLCSEFECCDVSVTQYCWADVHADSDVEYDHFRL